MKNLTKFLTVFLLALLGANLQPAWAAAQKYIYCCISKEYQDNKDADNWGFNFWGGTSGGVKSPTWIQDKYNWDNRDYWVYRVEVYDDNDKVQFKGNSDWWDPNNGFMVTLTGATNNAIFFSHEKNGWGGQFQQNYQVSSDGSLTPSSSTTHVGTQVTLTPALTSNEKYNDIKSTSYSVTTNPNNAGSVSSGKFSATKTGTYVVKATITYNAKGFTGITKTVEATTTIEVVDYYVTGPAFSSWGDWTTMTEASSTDYTITINTIGSEFKVSNTDSYNSTWYKSLSWDNTEKVGVTQSGTLEEDANAKVTLASGYTTPVVLHLNPSGPKIWAVATPKTTTVTLNPKEGTGGSTSVTAKYGSAMPSITKPSKTGYDFQGYYDADGSTSGNWGTQYYTSSGASARTWDKDASTSTLYAKWTAHKYTITYQDQGGNAYSGDNSSLIKTHTYDTQTNLVDGTKTGYTFLGWFDNSGCTGTARTTIGAQEITANLTLYAKWQINQYNVSYPTTQQQTEGHYTISANTTSGNYNTTASFTATPDKGYRLMVTATYGSNKSVSLTHNDFTYDYSFTIPAGDVTINVTAYRYGLAYSLTSGDFGPSNVVYFNETTDQVVLSNLAAHSSYKFKLYNEAYTSTSSSHFMGNEGDWQIYKNDNNMVPSIGDKCFYINTGSEGNYVISLNDNTSDNKPSINLTYPDVCKINIDNKDYTLTQVGETNIYETESILLNRDVDYWFYLYWHGPRLGNEYGNTMSNTNHKGWKYESQYYDKQAKLSTYNTPKTAHYKFQFNATESKLTVIYPTAISGGFPDGNWTDLYTLTFTDNVGTVNIPLDASETQIGFKVVDDGEFYGAASTNITATQENIALTKSDESSYDMKLTPSVPGTYTFTYDRSTPKLSVVFPTSTKTYDVTVYKDGITPTTVNVGLTPETITAVIPESMVFDQWVKEGDVIINDPSLATTTITATGAGASVRATFKTQKTIYLKNNVPDWNDVWLYLYNDPYWDENLGAGSKNITHQDKQATNIKNTNIWYYNYSDLSWNGKILAYTNQEAHDHEHFYMVKCSYFDGIRGNSDFSDQTPLFVSRNWISKDANSSQYYLEGIWMKYNSTESGFDLRGKNANDGNDNSITWDANQHKFTAPTPGEYTFSTTLHLLGDQTYNMKVYDVANRYYAFKGNTMRSTDCSNYKLNLKDPNNFSVQTTAAGDYVFTISVGGGEMLLSITYPLSDNDYRVIYYNGTSEKDNGYIIKNVGTEEKKDTASFFIDGTTGNVRLQKCTNAADQTWEDVTGQSIALTSYSEGVYNFIVSQNGGSATLSEGGKYNGKFYIRTDGVDGGWESFKTNADNVMTDFGSELDAGVTYDNFQYDYYKTKWVHSGKNVKFRIANDYSKAISEDFAADAIINNKETLPQDANVRFMWNSKTNQLKRAYISGSTDISDRFLVLEGDAKMFDKDGNELNIQGLKPNEINFTDKNDWVYQADIKAQPGCAVKLTAKYNNQVQYFIGSESTSKTIIDGTSGSTKQYSMRAVYDFKTNRLTAGWVPDGTRIDDELKLGGDLLLVREGQGDVRQITFGVNEKTHEPGKVTDIQHIYSVLTIKKDTMIGTTEHGYEDRATNEDYAKTMYWVSFPFAVKVSEIFGVDGYGTKWIMQKYNGEKRAEIGWFTSQTSTFWEFIDESETLEAYKGYLFLINANYFNTSGADVWKNSATEANFYFPSTEDEIGIIKADTYDQPVPAHACGIDQEFTGKSGAKLNHKITDSYWNVIGVPAFQDAKASAALADGCTLKSYYKWKSDDNTYEVETTMDGMTFKTMHAYMVQFGGTLTWSNVSVVSKPATAPYAYADAKNYRIELFFNGNGAEDHTYINLADGASTDFVLNEDMMKIDNAGFPNIYSFAGAYDVAYNETTFDNQSVMLGVSAPKDGSYTFAMPKDFSGKAILIDLEEGTTTDLNVSNYSVDLNKGTYNNRFQLMLEVEAKTPTAIDNVNGEWSADGKTKKLLINDQIYLINGGRVYNATGVQLR